jgi:hypothetical protein
MSLKNLVNLINFIYLGNIEIKNKIIYYSFILNISFFQRRKFKLKGKIKL